MILQKEIDQAPQKTGHNVVMPWSIKDKSFSLADFNAKFNSDGSPKQIMGNQNYNLQLAVVTNIINMLKSSNFYDPVLKNSKKCLIITISALILCCIGVVVILSVINSNLIWTLVIGIFSILVVLIMSFVLIRVYNKKEKEYFATREMEFKMRLTRAGYPESGATVFNTRIGTFGSYIIIEFANGSNQNQAKIAEPQVQNPQKNP
jgi:hypothetical protein